jgi:hypothetical protein
MRSQKTPSLLAIVFISLHSATILAQAGAFQHMIPDPVNGKERLHVTAVRNRQTHPYDSYLQCLQLSQPLHQYPTVGTSLTVSPASNITMVVLPAESEEGWHRPPAAMWFFLLHGRAQVVTPSTGDEVWIEPPDARGARLVAVASGDGRDVAGRTGKRVEKQAVLALDVRGKGHLTFYSREQETVALQIPLGENWEEWVDALEIVADGPC